MTLRDIKARFFALRNGNTADILRRGGSRFGMIYGCDVPAISAIAREIGRNHELAIELWNDSNVRESRLLAPWLMDNDLLTIDDCVALAEGSVGMEDALMLAFRVLKRRPDAREILHRLNPDSVAFAALHTHLD